MSMGQNEVFTHVGDQVRVQAPNGRWVAPLITGTFGSSDFIHSLLGGKSSTPTTESKADWVSSVEASDKLVSLEVTTVHSMTDLHNFTTTY